MLASIPREESSHSWRMGAARETGNIRHRSNFSACFTCCPLLDTSYKRFYVYSSFSRLPRSRRRRRSSRLDRSRHPSSHPRSNTSVPNLVTAFSLAFRRNSSCFSVDKLKMCSSWWAKALARSSAAAAAASGEGGEEEGERGCEWGGSGARKPVEPAQLPDGTMMSFSGPAEACARVMRPAA